MEPRLQRRRSRGVSATEYIVVAVLVGLSGVGIWSRLGPSAKCHMQQALQKFGDSSGTAVSCDDSGGSGGASGGASGGGAASTPLSSPAAGASSSPSASGGGTESPPGSDESCTGGICTAPGNCFVAGTEVISEDGPVAIEQVTVGMRVLSRDPGGDGNGTEWKSVAQTFAHHADALVALTIARGDTPETIEVTPNHLVFARGRGWVGVAELTPGLDHLVDDNGRDLDVLSAVSFAADTTVYNFEVEGLHTYYVGAHSLWVHNTCPHGKDYTCYLCGESSTGNLTGPSYGYTPNIVTVTPSYNPPNIVTVAPSSKPSSYAPAPKPTSGGGGGGAGGNGGGGAKLSSAELAAVTKYTAGSNYLNKPLRNGETLPKKDWQDVQNLDSALTKLPKTSTTFYRGISANSNILKKKYITDLGYMSFTDSKKVATEFFDSPLKPMAKGDHPTLFVYEGKLPGIQQFSKYEWEKEFLMGRGANLKVLDAYTNKDGVQILVLGQPKPSGHKEPPKKPKEIAIGYVKKGSTIKHGGKEWTAPASGQYYINTKGQLELEK